MKFVSNLVSLSILATSLSAFNVSAAIADTKPMKPLKMEVKQNAQEVIKEAFAKFSVELHSTKVSNAQIIYRQAITEAAMQLKNAGVSTSDLVQYAVSDMNSLEAQKFQTDIKAIAGADLNSPEGEELLQRIMDSQGRGSNFLPCGVGMTVAWSAGIGAFITGIVALASLGDVSRMDREGIDKERAAINSEITILKAEGVQDNSYLITSRKAELVQLDLEYSQLLAAKERNEKTVKTLGMVSGGLALVAILGAVSSDCPY